MQQELGTNQHKSATIREIFSHDSYKKGPSMLRGHQFQMNFPRKAAVELIL